jgi:hypothetical protein
VLKNEAIINKRYPKTEEVSAQPSKYFNSALSFKPDKKTCKTEIVIKTEN